MSSDAAAVGAARGKAPFAPFHKWDRNFFLLYVGLIWLGILMGFGSDLVSHFAKHRPAYPPIVHFHAAVFVSWLVVLTAQVLLIRTRRHDVHYKLGVAAMGLAVLMVVLGPATAIVVHGAEAGTPQDDPAFLSIQLTDIVAFAGLAGAAFLFRGKAAAHKRLILLATIYISDAGFARWLGGGFTALFGDGFFGAMASLYLPSELLAMGLGGYDLATRGKLHPAYVAGLAWMFAMQILAVTLYLSPAWKPVALALLGR
ncbi:MAG TPA: hypothetical protein VGF56_02460 [Rhizomicrobium sp.]|jgi:hypothetical protein